MKTDNELIAEFMDGITFDSDGFCTDPERKYSWRPGCYDPLRVERLAYHANWNWLMPVVEKISKMYNPDFEDGKYYDVEFAHSLFDLRLDAPINEVYSEVVKSIKWYNSNREPKES